MNIYETVGFFVVYLGFFVVVMGLIGGAYHVVDSLRILSSRLDNHRDLIDSHTAQLASKKKRKVAVNK